MPSYWDAVQTALETDKKDPKAKFLQAALNMPPISPPTLLGPENKGVKPPSMLSPSESAMPSLSEPIPTPTGMPSIRTPDYPSTFTNPDMNRIARYYDTPPELRMGEPPTTPPPDTGTVPKGPMDVLKNSLPGRIFTGITTGNVNPADTTQFARILGAYAAGIAPNSPGGREGANLAELGQQNVKEALAQRGQDIHAGEVGITANLRNQLTAERIKRLQTSPESSLYGKIDISKFTPESIRTFGVTKDPADLRTKPPEVTPVQRETLDIRKEQVQQSGELRQEGIDLRRQALDFAKQAHADNIALRREMKGGKESPEDKKQEKAQKGYEALMGKVQSEVDKIDQQWYSSKGQMSIDEYNRRVKNIKHTYGVMLEPYRKFGLWYGWDKGATTEETKSKGETPTAPAFKSADDVKAAFTAGKITKDKALEILRKDYGMK